MQAWYRAGVSVRRACGGTHLEELLRPNRQPQRLSTLPQHPHGLGSRRRCRTGSSRRGPIAACSHRGSTMHASDCADWNRGACTAVHPRASFTRPPSNCRPTTARVGWLTKHVSADLAQVSRVVDSIPAAHHPAGHYSVRYIHASAAPVTFFLSFSFQSVHRYPWRPALASPDWRRQSHQGPTTVSAAAQHTLR